MRAASSKAQGMSLNIVIIAVIAIAVLVVLIIIFGSKMTSFRTSTSACEAKGGQCMAAQDCPEDTFIRHLGTDCQQRHVDDASVGELCCQRG